jgi:hypothetical protein
MTEAARPGPAVVESAYLALLEGQANLAHSTSRLVAARREARDALDHLSAQLEAGR